MWNCNWGYPFGHGGWFMGHGLFGMVFGILLFLLILSLAITLVRSLIPKAVGNRDKKDSLEILREKFARGEISAEEYHRLRNILSG